MSDPQQDLQAFEIMDNDFTLFFSLSLTIPKIKKLAAEKQAQPSHLVTS